MAGRGSDRKTASVNTKDNLNHELEIQAKEHTFFKKEGDGNIPEREFLLKCQQHDGQLIDSFCLDHNEICCAICKKDYHSSCLDLKAIEEVAEQGEIGQELLKLETDLYDRQRKLISIKNVEQLKLERLLQHKDEMQKTIREFRQNVRNRLDTEENSTADEEVEIFQKKVQSKLANIKMIDEVLAGLSTIQHIKKEDTPENVIEIFVCLQIVKNYQKKASHIEKKTEQCRKAPSQAFYPNPQLVKFLNENEGLGQVCEVASVSTATWYADVNVSAPDDDFPCEISDFCQTDDGRFYVTDYINRRLKRLNSSFSVIDSLDLPSFPWGVCQMDEEHLLVTLKQGCKVLIVSVAESMAIESSFGVGDKVRGIAHFNGHIYVCCGGSQIYNEGIGRMEIYNTDGKILRAYFQHFLCPSDVKISNSGTQIYVSDAYSGLVATDINGRLLYKVEFEKVDVLCGICKIGRNMSCVAGFKSNNIILVDEDEKSYREILGIKDGIVHPKGLHFDAKLSLLFVSMGSSNIIKLFRIE